MPACAPTLLDSIRQKGARRASDLLPWLEQLASGLDHGSALGLPGVESAPASVILVGHQDPAGPRPVLMPRLHLSEQQVGTGTMDGYSLAPGLTPTSPVAGFSRLAYWLLAAHGPKDAALATPTAYVATGCLGVGLTLADACALRGLPTKQVQQLWTRCGSVDAVL